MRGKTEREGRALWCTARPDFLGGLPNALREGLHVDKRQHRHDVDDVNARTNVLRI